MRKMEKLTRGLVAARVENGMYLTWRFLGHEPDGISWRLYRRRGDGPWALLTELHPRDVAPESHYPENPGVVKRNTTPCCYTDPDGREDDDYAVAPVTDGVEGPREGLARDVDEEGALLIDTAGGSVRIAAGEVSVRASREERGVRS